jgi:hypothetical protein
MGEQPVTETSTWTTHNIHERHTPTHLAGSEHAIPASNQAHAYMSGRIPTCETARLRVRLHAYVSDRTPTCQTAHLHVRPHTYVSDHTPNGIRLLFFFFVTTFKCVLSDVSTALQITRKTLLKKIPSPKQSQWKIPYFYQTITVTQKQHNFNL